MRYDQVVDAIVRLVRSAKSFGASGTYLQKKLNAASAKDLLDHLDYAGVIPEVFPHDSTEEKIFAKYCDALLARALIDVGLSATVIEKRADAADVEARCKNIYTLVGDAKAFRLSRTAKNQKDFKVESLNEWRHGADYAVLLAPLYQYPNTASQIYSQAIRYNVTLLSYTHLAFLIRNRNFSGEDLRALWEVGRNLTANESAINYWAVVRACMLKLTGKTNEDWELVAGETSKRLHEQARQEIRFWQREKLRISKLEQREAVEQLISALKIDSKIAIIRKTGGL